MLGYGVRMESLALVVALVVLGIIVFGLVALVIALRSPQRRWARIAASLAVVPALLGGLWLALLQVGIGARLIGATVLTVGVLALLRTWRSH